jgi:YfiH family protein
VQTLTYNDFISGSDPQIAYGFFSRQGGVSQGIFSSLNCKPGSGDDPDAITENRRRVGKVLQCSELVTLDQIHSDICHRISKPVPDGTQGDALVTSTPGLAIGVLTADCAPVLFSGQKADGTPVIGAAHAGWGGAVKGVLEATIAAMVLEGTAPETIGAAIGPCIAKPSYEVSPEFPAPFLAEDPQSSQFFFPLASGKYLFDLPAYVGFRLNRAGIHKVTIGGQDTYNGESDWFSFRRSTHRQETQYGRQISAISIRSS